MGIATLIVPPIYEAQLLGDGAFAVKITARKVHLLDRGGKSIASCFYKGVHQVAKKTFSELVDFVRSESK